MNELTHAARALTRSAKFTLAAAVTLALGIGSTTAIFSVVRSVLLNPLPFADAGRVVVPQSTNTSTSNFWSVTYADFMDWRDNHVFDKVAVYQSSAMDLAGAGDPVRVQSAGVSPQFFEALGTGAAKGRVLQPVDYPVDAARAVVISDRLWRSQFGARPDIIGQEIELNAIKRPIVGVLPPGVQWPLDNDVWVPLRVGSENDPDLLRRDNFIFEAIARLAPHSTLASTRAAMARLARLAELAHPDIRKSVSTLPTPVLDYALGASVPRMLWILLAAVGLLLLIGCVNVANLQLARAAARHRELAVRTALGASRLRLVRQSLVESLLLALGGGIAGVALAVAMVRVLVAAAPPDVPRIDAAAIDPLVLLFAFAISLGVALIFGLAPALHAAHSDPQLALAEGGTRAAGGRSGTRARRLLVAVELALSVILLVGAGLALRSVSRLRHADVGFDTHNILSASISLPGIRYDKSDKVVGFLYALRDRLAALPGVEAAGIASASPLGGGGFYLGRMMVAEGRDQSPAGEVPISWNVATPGYFAALRVPIVRGRDFTARDDTASAPVMIVSEKFARSLFPNENPIGKRAMSSRDEKVYREIIGVVKDIKYYGASDSARSLVWVPYAQRNAWHQGILTVRTNGDPLLVLPAVRRELRSLDPGIALANVATMDDTRARSMAGDRLVAILLGAFAALALTLAAVGIFGVLSYALEQRTHELGIRVALGARPADVLTLVARETIPMVGAGLVTGLVVAAALTRFIRSMLYEIQPGDPTTFIGVSLVLAAIAILAALLPARRAAHVDPVIALRGE